MLWIGNVEEEWGDPAVINRLIFRLGGRRVLKTSLLLHALLTRRSVSDVVHRLGRRLLRDASAMRLLFTNFTFFSSLFFHSTLMF